MEKTYRILKIVFLVLCFVALLLGAGRLYDALGAQVSPELPVQTEAAAEPEKTEAPEFTVYDDQGASHKLSDFRGKPVILNFWATWCGFCQMHMPYFEDMYQSYGQQIHFLMVNVTDGNTETQEKASTYIADSGYTFPVYYDTTLEASSAYPTNGLPVTFFIDDQGYVVTWHSGAMNPDMLQTGIDLLLEA